MSTAVAAPDLITTEEFAQITRRSAKTIRRLANGSWRGPGRFPRQIVFGRQLLFERSEVLAFIAGLRSEPDEQHLEKCVVA